MIRLLAFLFLTLIGADGWAQTEQRVPLRYNAELVTKAQERGTGSRSSATVVYLLDTIQDLPIIDDFTSNRQTDYQSHIGNPNVIDSLSWWFTLDGVPVDTGRIKYDTTYSYIKNNLTNSIDTVPNDTLVLIFFDNFLPTDTISPVWPATSSFVDGPVVNVTQLTPDDVYINRADTICIVPPDPNAIYVIDSDSLQTIGHSAFINRHYGVNPPSYGVATFDGVDGMGQPYNFFDPDSYGPADELVSKPINLGIDPQTNLQYTDADSIYFSFFYQPMGYGDNPSPRDSLVLEFYAPNQAQWKNMWNIMGDSLRDFDQILIRVDDTAFLQTGFRFRFRNYASLNGYLDHWHVDYIRLDKNRSIGDTLIDDVSFMYPGPSMIKTYTHMPWDHFTDDRPAFMAESLRVSQRNLWNIDKFVENNYFVYDDQGTLLYQSTANQWTISNFPSLAPLARDIPLSVPGGLEDFVFPALTGRTTFEMRHEGTSANDQNADNDVVVNYQHFGSFYAYDDGTAEYGWMLPAAGSDVAMEFELAEADTFQGLYVYFPRHLEDFSNRAFRIKVWSSLNPEVVEYEATLTETPVYTDNINEWHRYEIEDPLVLSGTVYIGWRQILADVIVVGMDANNDNSQHLFYNPGTGWRQSLLPGSFMIRPDFGIEPDPPVSVEEPEPFGEEFDVKMYPNPARDEVRLEVTGVYDPVQVRIFDLQGRLMWQDTQFTGQPVDVGAYSPGLYMVRIENPTNGDSRNLRLVVSH